MKQIQKDGCMVALKINNILIEALDQQWGRRKTEKDQESQDHRQSHKGISIKSYYSSS